MKIMVMGATGATGRHVVKDLLSRGAEVVAPVRSKARLEEALGADAEAEGLTILEETVLGMAPSRLEAVAADCDAAISCLGHNLTWKGIFGRPRRLVADSVRIVCEAAWETRLEYPELSRPFRMVLMNTTGNRFPAEDKRRGIAEVLAMGLIRLILPPQRDNEEAAAYLSQTIGPGDGILEWTAVRPDTLVNDNADGDYTVVSAPRRSPVFNAGKTSRGNAALFMAELASNDIVWEEWKGRMPVVYNSEYMPAAV